MPASFHIEAMKALEDLDRSNGHKYEEFVHVPIMRIKETFDKLHYIPDEGYAIIETWKSLIDSKIDTESILKQYRDKKNKLPDISKITITDLTELEISDKSEEEQIFDFVAARNNLIQKYNLKVSTKSDAIYWHDGQIYSRNGKDIVAYILFEIMGNEIKKHDVFEVLERINAKLNLEKVEFDSNPYLLGVENELSILKLEHLEIMNLKI
jgi:hypothetical protein